MRTLSILLTAGVLGWVSTELAAVAQQPDESRRTLGNLDPESARFSAGNMGHEAEARARERREDRPGHGGGHHEGGRGGHHGGHHGHGHGGGVEYVVPYWPYGGWPYGGYYTPPPWPYWTYELDPFYPYGYRPGYYRDPFWPPVQPGVPALPGAAIPGGAVPGQAVGQPPAQPAPQPELAAPPAPEPEPPKPVDREALARAWRYIGFGDAHFQAGRYTDAYTRYKKAAASESDLADAQLRQGVALIAMGSYELAAKAIKKAIALDEGWAQTTLRLDDLYGQGNPAKHAHLDALSRAEQQNRTQADLAFLVGVALLFDGQQQQALPMFQRAASLGFDRSLLVGVLPAGVPGP